MQINVTVEGLEAVDLNTPVVNTESSEPLTLADVIAAHALHKIAYEDIRDLRRRISDIRDEQIRAIVLPTVTEAIEAGIQKTDQWGSPVGQPTTLRDLVLKEAKELINRPADNYDRKKGTVLEKVVREAVDRTIRAELSEALAAEKAKVVAAVQAQAAELIAEAVKKGLGR